MNNNVINNFLELKKIAVVGVSNDRSKYGNIVFRKLKEKNYVVYPVNPNTSSVEEEICYPSLSELPDTVEGAVLIVPPKITEEIVREAYAVGLKYIWLQPGAESKEAVKYCNEQGINCIFQRCILVEVR